MSRHTTMCSNVESRRAQMRRSLLSGWILSKDWCIGCLSIINPSWVVFEHSLIWSSIMCPRSDQLDRSLDWRQLGVPFLEWQVSSDESSSELVRCCSFLTFICFPLLLLDCLCW